MKNTWSVAYVFNTGRLSRLEAAHCGDAPREFFFGALELEDKGHRVGYFETDSEYTPGWPGNLLNQMLSPKWMPEKMSGGLLSQVYDLLPLLNHYDCIVGTTSGIGFALSFFLRLGMLHRPVAVIHCGLVNNPYNSFRKWATALLLRQSRIILYGEGEHRPLCALFPGIENVVYINQFGVDVEFWSPDRGVLREDFVLSVGNDGRRDYDTLIRASKNYDYPIRVVTSRQMPTTLPANMQVLKGSWHKETISDADLRLLYRKARCVVIPLIDSFQPSGQSVALQAMACACPVILTHTVGLWNSKMIKDHENILFVPPEDAVALARMIRRIMDGEIDVKKLGDNGYETVKEQASLDKFATSMERILESMLDKCF